MKRLIVAGAVALMCAGGAAGAQEDAMSPAEIVAGRQAAFGLSGVTMGAIKAGIDSNAPAASLAFPTGALAKWAAALPGTFPAGTGMDSLPGATRAKAEIWTDRAGFEAKAADYVAATGRLRDAAASGDSARVATEWAAVRNTCGSCHEAYRE